MNSRQTLLRDVLILFAFAGWAVALPGFASDFVLSLALTCLMYVALSTSWALFCGTTRYLSLATAAFFGVGAYTSALLVETWPWWQVVALGALVAALLAVFMGALVLHLRGTYFAILTFGMTELIRHTVTFYESTVTGTVGRMILVAPDSKTATTRCCCWRWRRWRPRSWCAAPALAWPCRASAPTSNGPRPWAWTPGWSRSVALP